MITIIDLNYSHNPFPLLSQELIDWISRNLELDKKILIFLNRRWEAWTLICRDCSYQFKCSECDIAMSVHKYPRELLICNSCEKTEQIPSNCPNCRGANLQKIWVWTQKIEQYINGLFKDKKISRLDSDKIRKEWIDINDIKNSDIIIATEIVNTISFDNLWLVVFPLFEWELVIWDYDIEEKIYTNITQNIKRWSDVIIQTHIPKNQLLKTITEWNYKEFLVNSLEERKKFWYPPYNDLAHIYINWKDKVKLSEFSENFLNKLRSLYSSEKYSISYNKNSFSKKSWDYYQKIIIKWIRIEEFLKPLKMEIIRNRSINLEWK